MFSRQHIFISFSCCRYMVDRLEFEADIAISCKCIIGPNQRIRLLIFWVYFYQSTVRQILVAKYVRAFSWLR